MKNFVVVGAAGYIAERHFEAITATGNAIRAVIDPNDAGGIGKVDSYTLDAEYFSTVEDLLAERATVRAIDYFTVCSPNDLHFRHCQMALQVGAQVICEKPLVIQPEHLDRLSALESETGGHIHAILQFRHHSHLLALREALFADYPPNYRHEVSINFVLPRGKWYKHSWKGKEEHSGGIAMHLGIHVFDLLLWLFGSVRASSVHVRDGMRMAGSLALERARVRWLLSCDPNDLPDPAMATQGYRSFTIGSRHVEFSNGRMQLHRKAYEEILAGRGFGIEDARPAIELVHQLNMAALDDRPCGKECVYTP